MNIDEILNDVEINKLNKNLLKIFYFYYFLCEIKKIKIEKKKSSNINNATCINLYRIIHLLF